MLKFDSALITFMTNDAEAVFQKTKDKENKSFRREIKKMLEDGPNIPQYLYDLIIFGLIPGQNRMDYLSNEEKEMSSINLLVIKKISGYGELKKKLPSNGGALGLYRSQILFTSMVAHYSLISKPEGSIKDFKKTLTSMYIPDKSKNEKEGAFYKEVQELILKRNEELSTIWEFVIGRPLSKYKDAELKAVAHKDLFEQESMDNPQPVFQPNESSTFDFKMSPQGKANFFEADLSTDTIEKSHAQTDFTLGPKRVDESTGVYTSKNPSTDPNESLMLDHGESQDNIGPNFGVFCKPVNFKKQINNAAEKPIELFAHSQPQDQGFFKILSEHVEV